MLLSACHVFTFSSQLEIKTSREASNMAARRRQRAQNVPKRAPRRPQDSAREPSVGPRRSQDISKLAQERLRKAPRQPKTAPKDLPNGQERTKTAQKGSKTAHDATIHMTQRCLYMVHDSPKEAAKRLPEVSERLLRSTQHTSRGPQEFPKMLRMPTKRVKLTSTPRYV